MIIVTGASGLLGSNLLLHLLERGMNALGLYHNHPLTHSGLQVDFTDRAFVENLLERLQPRWIIHCAAVTDVDWCEQYPEQTYLLNATVPEHLAQIAQRLGIRMVYVSTDSVFDGIDGYYGEEDLTGPLNVYAQSKLAGEQAVLRQLQQSL